jgi:serine/threonine protein kinase
MFGAMLNGKRVALKSVTEAADADFIGIENMLVEMITQFAGVGCDTILECRGLYWEKVDGFLQMNFVYDFIPQNLFQWINVNKDNHDDATNQQRLIFTMDIIQAVDFLHAQGLVHADLKPENMLVVEEEEDGFLHVQVCDLGFCSAHNTGLGGGTSVYQSVQSATMKNRNNHDLSGALKETDLHALACVLVQLYTGYAPFMTSDGEVAVATSDKLELDKVAQYCAKDWKTMFSCPTPRSVGKFANQQAFKFQFCFTNKLEVLQTVCPPAMINLLRRTLENGKVTIEEYLQVVQTLAQEASAMAIQSLIAAGGLKRWHRRASTASSDSEYSSTEEVPEESTSVTVPKLSFFAETLQSRTASYGLGLYETPAQFHQRQVQNRRR